MRDLRGLSNLFRVPFALSNQKTALATTNALLHVYGMKHLTLAILLALAPLSWGEDVWYCVEELKYKIEDNDSNGLFELQRYNGDKFTLKYIAERNQLVLKGRTYGVKFPTFMDCRSCYPDAPYFDAYNRAYVFTMQGDRFFMAATTFDEARMLTGTCTKF